MRPSRRARQSHATLALLLGFAASCANENLTQSNRISESSSLQAGQLQPYIVTFKPEVIDTESRARAMVDSVGGRVRFVYTRALNGFAADLPPQAAEDFARLPYVLRVSHDPPRDVLTSR